MMPQSFITIVSGLFRKSEETFGTRDFCFNALYSWEKAIQDFEGSKEKFHEELNKMVYLVKHTSPRIAFLIFMVITIMEQFEEFQTAHEGASLEEEKIALSEIIQSVITRRKQSVQKLIFASEGIIKNNTTIMLHDPSHTLFDILLHAQKMGKKFKIMVAEQESEKTAIIIDFLQKNSFEFTVVPEYLLSHIEKDIDLVLGGGTTVNSLYEVVADAGTHSLVSEMKEAGVPIYIAITTDKFSLWKAEEHHAHKQQKHVTSSGVEYDKLIFSHDRFPIFWATGFITNKGVLSAEQVKEFYDEEYQKQENWRKKHSV